MIPIGTPSTTIIRGLGRMFIIHTVSNAIGGITLNRIASDCPRVRGHMVYSPSNPMISSIDHT